MQFAEYTCYLTRCASSLNNFLPRVVSRSGQVMEINEMDESSKFLDNVNLIKWKENTICSSGKTHILKCI